MKQIIIHFSKKLLLAKIISSVFNPFILFAPIQIIFFILTQRPNSDLPLLLLVITFQVLIPLVLIVLFIKLKLIDDYEITNRKQRSIYFIIVVLLEIIPTILTAHFFPANIVNISLCFSMAMVIVINFSWKISGHLTFDTILFLGLGLINPVFLLSLAILPLVAWSRVVLKKHTIAQTIGGILLGLIVFAATMLLSSAH